MFIRICQIRDIAIQTLNFRVFQTRTLNGEKWVLVTQVGQTSAIPELVVHGQTWGRALDRVLCAVLLLPHPSPTPHHVTTLGDVVVLIWVFVM
jgi:hypothetical protein